MKLAFSCLLSVWFLISGVIIINNAEKAESTHTVQTITSAIAGSVYSSPIPIAILKQDNQSLKIQDLQKNIAQATVNMHDVNVEERQIGTAKTAEIPKNLNSNSKEKKENEPNMTPVNLASSTVKLVTNTEPIKAQILLSTKEKSHTKTDVAERNLELVHTVKYELPKDFYNKKNGTTETVINITEDESNEQNTERDNGCVPDLNGFCTSHEKLALRTRKSAKNDSDNTDNWKGMSWDTFCKMQPNGHNCGNKGLKQVYFYDHQLQDCVTVKIGIECGFNFNSFRNRADCMRSCGVAGIRPIKHSLVKRMKLPLNCRMQPDFGECAGYYPRFYFDLTQMVCRGFSYSGCGGNFNRFDTSDECANACAKIINYSANPSEATVPPADAVPLFTAFPNLDSISSDER